MRGRTLLAAPLCAVPVAALVVAGPLVLGHLLFAIGFKPAAARLLRDPAWTGYTLAARGRYLEAVEAFGSAAANAYDRGNALVGAGLYGRALDAYDEALQADPEDEDARYNRALVEKVLDLEATSAGETGGNANAAATRERKHGGQGNQDGDTNSVGIGFVGNKEGASTSGAQGGSKVSKIGKGQNAASGADGEKASGSAGQAAGRGRSGGDLADITEQLALNQRRYSPAYVSKSLQPNLQWLQTVPDDPGQFLKLQIRAERKRRQAQADRAQGDD